VIDLFLLYNGFLIPGNISYWSCFFMFLVCISIPPSPSLSCDLPSFSYSWKVHTYVELGNIAVGPLSPSACV